MCSASCVGDGEGGGNGEGGRPDSDFFRFFFWEGFKVQGLRFRV